MRFSLKTSIVLFSAIAIMAFTQRKNKPTLYLIGDSTVAELSANDSLFGRGKLLPQFLDTSKIGIKNYALGGKSARTFQTNGYWDIVCKKMKKGDYLMIQFGINDQSKVNDTLRARGTLKGIGADSLHIFNLLTKKYMVEDL